MFDPDTVISFDEALSAAGDHKPHLLLGNGFSIAWQSDVFRYGALLDAAEFADLTVDGRALFATLETQDFERVIESLRVAAVLAELYEPGDPARSDRLRADADRIKDELARVIALRHPDQPNVVIANEFDSASRFLAHFDHIYTVNYDLLLYWTAIQGLRGLTSDDGFRADPDEPDATWVTWDASGRSRRQSLYYLHGALHLFDRGDRLTKFTWNRTGIRLIEQVRAALAQNAYPLVATEGTSSEKLDKINHSAYLSHAYRSFAALSQSRALFVFGHSLGETDDHIIRLIPSGTIRDVFVSVRGAPSEDTVTRLRAIHDARGGTPELNIHLYQADSARVWR